MFAFWAVLLTDIFCILWAFLGRPDSMKIKCRQEIGRGFDVLEREEEILGHTLEGPQSTADVAFVDPHLERATFLKKNTRFYFRQEDSFAGQGQRR